MELKTDSSEHCTAEVIIDVHDGEQDAFKFDARQGTTMIHQENLDVLHTYGEGDDEVDDGYQVVQHDTFANEEYFEKTSPLDVN